jgi:hypothetical protein
VFLMNILSATHCWLHTEDCCSAGRSGIKETDLGPHTVHGLKTENYWCSSRILKISGAPADIMHMQFLAHVKNSKDFTTHWTLQVMSEDVLSVSFFTKILILESLCLQNQHCVKDTMSLLHHILTSSFSASRASCMIKWIEWPWVHHCPLDYWLLIFDFEEGMLNRTVHKLLCILLFWQFVSDVTFWTGESSLSWSTWTAWSVTSSSQWGLRGHFLIPQKEK